MLSLIVYPNSVLTKKTVPISHIDESILKLIEKMRIVMKENNGVGLSANQVGENISLSIIEFNDENNFDNNIPFLTLINPKIIKKTEPYITTEGCLSLPKQEFEIERYKKIELLNTDLNNNRIKIKANGFLAQIIQRETDHLNGILLCKSGKKK